MCLRRSPSWSSLVFVSQGAIQNFESYKDVATLQVTTYQTPKTDAQGNAVKDAKGNPVMQDNKADKQTIAMGPVASQEAIKMLGTNGGGFFNANSAHPFENPTPFSNFVQMIAMLVIPAALCVVFGRMVGDRRQGYAVLAAMTIAFAVACWGEISAEQAGNPLFASLHVDQTASALQAGGNMEGKETRFGIAQSGIFTVATTAASCGAVQQHARLAHAAGRPGSAAVDPVRRGDLRRRRFGPVRDARVRVARGVRRRADDRQNAGVRRQEDRVVRDEDGRDRRAADAVPGAARRVDRRADRRPGTAGIANPGPHGFSEILYAYSSAANNNGSAFAGLTVSTPFYNVTTGIAMWFGRFGSIIPVLAIAGALAAKKRIAATAGTLPTHGPLFVVLLLGTVVLVGALTYVPALALGPVVEHLMMLSGK